MVKNLIRKVRLYLAAVQLSTAQKLLELEQELGADAEHILRAQALVNQASRAHLAILEE